MTRLSADEQRAWKKEHPEQVKQYKEKSRASEKQRAKDDPVFRAQYYKGIQARNKRYREHLRDITIDALGGKCIRCGFTDKRALQFDHINGGGRQEFKMASSGRAYYLSLYKSVLNGEGKYQLLCANCNWIKRYEEKEGVGTR